MNFIIQDAESITCMVELLEHCEVTCQAEIWSMFTAILRKSVRNLQTCTEVGLIQQVLQKMSSVDDMIAGTWLSSLGRIVYTRSQKRVWLFRCLVEIQKASQILQWHEIKLERNQTHLGDIR